MAMVFLKKEHVVDNGFFREGNMYFQGLLVISISPLGL